MCVNVYSRWGLEEHQAWHGGRGRRGGQGFGHGAQHTKARPVCEQNRGKNIDFPGSREMQLFGSLLIRDTISVVGAADTTKLLDLSLRGEPDRGPLQLKAQSSVPATGLRPRSPDVGGQPLSQACGADQAGPSGRCKPGGPVVLNSTLCACKPLLLPEAPEPSPCA